MKIIDANYSECVTVYEPGKFNDEVSTLCGRRTLPCAASKHSEVMRNIKSSTPTLFSSSSSSNATFVGFPNRCVDSKRPLIAGLAHSAGMFGCLYALLLIPGSYSLVNDMVRCHFLCDIQSLLKVRFG